MEYWVRQKLGKIQWKFHLLIKHFTQNDGDDFSSYKSWGNVLAPEKLSLSMGKGIAFGHRIQYESVSWFQGPFIPYIPPKNSFLFLMFYGYYVSFSSFLLSFPSLLPSVPFFQDVQKYSAYFYQRCIVEME